MLKSILIVTAMSLMMTAFGQMNYFSLKPVVETRMDYSRISASNSLKYTVDLLGLKDYLKNASYREDANINTSNLIISLPHPDGGLKTYRVLRNKTLSTGLSLKFPDILTFDAVGIDDNTERVKLDVTPQGMHAMIMSPNHSTIFIDPVSSMEPNKVIVYFKKDFYTDKIKTCDFVGSASKEKGGGIPTKDYGSCELRTYRLALSATGEYTAFHGGTVALAQAAQATTMNRVNGVYEADMAITMTLVSNNNLIVYDNAGSDPFSNGNTNAMINENQSNTDAVIGTLNYDIGHVFGTNSGGLAGLGVVCGTSKARGVTGSAGLIGDPFDIDYVCHEMGHQFSGNHTQSNSCNSNPATAVEPGSASSIMGYAGICPPNVQSNSDDHFHGTSLLEISNFVTGTTHTCPVKTSLSNVAPVISSTNGNNVNVPANTPFALTAVATDADNDPLTYNWEQIDPGASGNQTPQANATNGPNFRSLPSASSPTRYFPNLTDLANGGPFTWEVLPNVTRSMDFRVSVRDNAAGGGCADYMDATVITNANAGPFVVNYPSATGITWAGLNNQTVTWAVANTDVAPINATAVDIYLSTDGGQSYPILVAGNVTNDGSQLITVPNSPTTTARIMIINTDGTFFDISDNDFTITQATNDFTIAATPGDLSICQGSDAVYTINSTAFGTFSDQVTLSVQNVPAGATAVFSTNPISANGTSTLTFTGVNPGAYSINVDGTSTTGTKTAQIGLTVFSGNPAAVSIVVTD